MVKPKKLHAFQTAARACGFAAILIGAAAPGVALAEQLVAMTIGKALIGVPMDRKVMPKPSQSLRRYQVPEENSALFVSQKITGTPTSRPLARVVRPPVPTLA